jgi:hypothetical protein
VATLSQSEFVVLDHVVADLLWSQGIRNKGQLYTMDDDALMALTGVNAQIVRTIRQSFPFIPNIDNIPRCETCSEFIPYDPWKAFQTKPTSVAARRATDEEDVITTQGVTKANPGDYVVRNAMGDLEVLRPDVFRRRFEVV